MKARILLTILILLVAVALIYLILMEPVLWQYIAGAIAIAVAVAALRGIHLIWRDPLAHLIRLFDPASLASFEKPKRLPHQDDSFANDLRAESDFLYEQEYLDRKHRRSV